MAAKQLEFLYQKYYKWSIDFSFWGSSSTWENTWLKYQGFRDHDVVGSNASNLGELADIKSTAKTVFRLESPTSPIYLKQKVI